MNFGFLIKELYVPLTRSGDTPANTTAKALGFSDTLAGLPLLSHLHRTMDAFDALPDDFETALSPRTPTFRLFDLPAELWLYILALSVIRPYPIDPTWARTTPEQSLVVAQPAITRTCRVLRKEGLLLYYSLNTFESQHLLRVACTRDWMIAIGETNRKAMKTFYFHCEFEPEFWIGQFKQCGIEVGIEEAAPESAVAVRMRKRKNASAAAKTLIVSFS